MSPKISATAGTRPAPGQTKDQLADDEAVVLAWRQFAAFLKSKGARITRARRRVLEQVFAHTDHFRADHIAADLARGARRVSRGTVYRTLALLVEAGLVREIRGSAVHTHYERTWGREPHEHLICEGCGRFIEFTDPSMVASIRKVCEKRGFKARLHRVVVFGLCDACQVGES